MTRIKVISFSINIDYEVYIFYVEKNSDFSDSYPPNKFFILDIYRQLNFVNFKRNVEVVQCSESQFMEAYYRHRVFI